MALRTDYQDFVANAAGKKYVISDAGDGMSTITDATTYDQIGDSFSAGVINATNAQVNTNTESIANMSPDEIGAIPTTEKGAANGVATLDENGKVVADQTSSEVSATIATSRTLEPSDAGKLLVANSTSAITLTIPADTFPKGAEIEVVQWSTGTVTIAADSNVGLRSLDSAVSTAGRYAVISLKQTGTNVWLLAGALA